MIPHRDEILRPAVSTDATAVPRFDLVRPDGTVAEKNAALKLANPVAREGTPISKAVLDEMLAASGVTAGTATAYTLAQEEYTLFDGAPVRFRLHVASGDGATLNINGTGAKPLRDMMGAAMPGGIPAGTWMTAYYSAAEGAYVLAGGEAVRALYGERYTVDDAVAHVKDVPGDALPAAEIGEIGGMTYKVNVGTEANPVYELRSAPVTEVPSVGVNLFGGEALADKLVELGGSKDEVEMTAQISASIVDNKVLFEGFKPNTQYTFIFDGYNTGGGIESNLRVEYTDGLSDSLAFCRGKIILCTAYGRSVAKLVGMWQTHNTVFNYDKCGVFEGVLIGADFVPYRSDTLPIPAAVKAIDGYGWGINADCYNYVDWKNKRFGKRVERVDMGTLEWAYDGNIFYAQVPDMRGDANVLCAAYREAESVYDLLNNSPAILAYYSNWENAVNVKDTAYTDVAAFKVAMSGVMLYYELAQPIITDISDILPADNLLRIEAGGTITAVNEYNYAVPTKITYQRDVLANRASIFALEKLRLAMELLAKADLSNVSGTFGGVVKANAAAVSALGTAQVRNVAIGATDLVAGSSALATGDSYRIYS